MATLPTSDWKEAIFVAIQADVRICSCNQHTDVAELAAEASNLISSFRQLKNLLLRLPK